MRDTMGKSLGKGAWKMGKNTKKGSKKGIHITKIEKGLTIVGQVLIGLNAAAYLIGGKIMFFLLITILLFSYAMYIRFYPYMYIEMPGKKAQEFAFQMPFIGASIALILCMFTLNTYNFDFGSYMKMTFCITVILAIPYLIKSYKTVAPQRFRRKASVVFAALVLAFGITFPVNYLLTFDEPIHETIVITDKDINSSGRTVNYYVYGTRNGKEEEFSVSRSEYSRASVGDRRRICIKRSILGLEYNTIHE